MLPGLLPDLLVLIASFLDAPESVLALRSTCRSTRAAFDASGWVQLHNLSRSSNPLPEDASNLAHLMQAYIAKYHYSLTADQLAGSWTEDSRYFARRVVLGAQSARVLQLRGVWWVDVVGVFEVRNKPFLAVVL